MGSREPAVNATCTHGSSSSSSSSKQQMSPKGSTGVNLREAEFPADVDVVACLFGAYAAALPISLEFQDFGREVQGLPGRYGDKEGGVVLLACINGRAKTVPEIVWREERVVGCVGLRRFAKGDGVAACELKRLYLEPEARGRGVARMLMDGVLQKARELGYREMLLDTLSSMTAAQALYRNYGFEEIPSYYQSVEGAVFFRLVL